MVPATNESSRDATLLLQRWRQGDSAACSQLVSLLYPELKKIAEMRIRAERRGHTLQATALVNEFFLQIARRSDLTWDDRAHFLAAASSAMRCLLVDYARARATAKRDRSNDIPLATACQSEVPVLDAILFNELLDRLQREEPRMAKVAELRCFGGLSHAEIAQVIGVDERTAKRDWQVARAWLAGQVRKESNAGRALGTR